MAGFKICPECHRKSVREQGNIRYCTHCSFAERRIVTWERVPTNVDLEEIIKKRRKEEYFIPTPRC